MKVTKEQADVYQVRGNNTWGDIFVQWGTSDVQVTANTDFGVYGYHWFDTGNPKRFLCEISRDYAMMELSRHKSMIPDTDRYQEEIEEQIYLSLVDGDLTKEEADRARNEMLGYGGTDSDIWLTRLVDHDLFKKVFGDIEYLPSAEKMDPQCVGFWENIWLPFVEQLRVELVESHGFKKCEWDPEPDDECENCGKKNLQMYHQGDEFGESTYLCFHCVIGAE